MKPKTRHLIAIANPSFAVTIGATDLKAQHPAGKVHVVEEELSSWTANGEVFQGPLMDKSTNIRLRRKRESIHFRRRLRASMAAPRTS
jgi:hypothetical protein